MSLGLYSYKTNAGRLYKVELDDALGSLPEFGFQPVPKDSTLDFLPRRMKMRSMGCDCLTPGVSPYRRFPVGRKNAPVLTSLKLFSYKGRNYQPRWYHPEKTRK